MNHGSIFTFSSFLMWIGTFNTSLQRVIVCSPLPILSSFVGLLVVIIVNTPAYIWIPLVVIFICGVIYMSVHIKSFVNGMMESLKALFNRDEANKLDVDGKCTIAAKHNVKLLKTLIKDDNYCDHDSDNEYLSDTDKYVNNIELTE